MYPVERTGKPTSIKDRRSAGITTHSRLNAVSEVDGFSAIEKNASMFLEGQEAYVVVDHAARDIAHITSFGLVNGFDKEAPKGEIPQVAVTKAIEDSAQPIGQIASALQWISVERRKDVILGLVEANFQSAWDRMDEAPNPNDPKGEDLKDNCRQLRDRGRDMAWVKTAVRQRFGAVEVPQAKRV